MSKPIYLDANALIEAVESNDTSGLLFLRAVHRRGTRFLTGELTFAEVSIGPIKDGDDDLLDLYEDLLFGDDLIFSKPVDREILRLSADASARFGGKLPDAIHVATAVAYECGILLSSDKRLRLPNGLRRMGLRELMKTGIGT